MSTRMLQRFFGQPDGKNVRVNVKLLLSIIVSLGIVGGMVHFVHGVVLDRNAENLLRKAQRAHDEGEFDVALQYQSRYVSFRPQNADAAVRLAEWSDDSAQKRTDENEKTVRARFMALTRLDHALTLIDQSDDELRRNDLRQRAIRLDFKLRRYHDVLTRLAELPAKDAEMTAIEARSRFALGEFDLARDSFLRAIEQDSKAFSNYEELLILVERRAGKFKLAPIEKFFTPAVAPVTETGDAAESAVQNDGSPAPAAVAPPDQNFDDRQMQHRVGAMIVAAMIDRAEPKFKAYLARAAYRQARGDIEGAVKDVVLAQEESPNESDVLLAVAQVETDLAGRATNKGDTEQVKAHRDAALAAGKKGLEMAPGDLRFFLTLTRLEIESGRPEEAEKQLRAGLEVARLVRADKKEEGKALTPEEGQLEGQVIRSLAGFLITQAFLGDQPADDVKLDEAKTLIAEMRQLGIRAAWIDYLEARISLGMHDWHDAVPKLERARIGVFDSPETVRMIILYLGECYGRLSNPDAQLALFRRAVDADPEWEDGRVALAATLANLGQIDAALDQYNYGQVRERPGVAASMSQLLVRKQMALPAADRKWDRVEKVVDVAREKLAGSPSAILLQADLLLRQQRFAEAEKLLAQACDSNPGEGSLWTALMELMLRRSDIDEASRIERTEQILGQAREKLGNTVALRQVAIQLAVYRGGAGAAASLESLQAEADALPRLEKQQLARTLAQAWVLINSPERGLALWQAIAETATNDLDVQIFLTDLAARTGDAEALQSALRHIRKIEGNDGPNGNYAEATMLLLKARRSRELAETAIRNAKSDAGRKRAEADAAADRTASNETLGRAERLYRQAALVRKSWAAIPRNLGLLEEMRGNREAAFEHYKQAFELGDRSRDTIMQVIGHLRVTGQYDEAQKVIRRLRDTAPELLSGNVARLGSMVAAAMGNVDQALELAVRVDAKTRSVRDVLWQAELESMKGDRSAEVDKLLRQATDMDPESGRAWIARVAALARENRTADALAVAQEAAEKLPAEPAYSRSLTLGLCYEVLGDRSTAEVHYLKAIEADGESIATRSDAINFYIRGNELAKADRLVGMLLDPAAKSPPAIVETARRTRALITATNGTYDELTAALKMTPGFESEPDLPHIAEPDLRTAATILAKSRLRRERSLQIRILEELARRQRLNHNELLQMARLLESGGRWPGARSIYRRMLEADPADTTVLAEFALNALRQKPIDAALLGDVVDAVDRLERREPDMYRTVLVRARLLAAQERSGDATAVLQKYLKGLKVIVVDDKLRELVQQKKSEEAISLLAEALRKKEDGDIRGILTKARELRKSGDDQAVLAAIDKYIKDADQTEAAYTQNLQSVVAVLESIKEFDAAETLLKQHAIGVRKPDVVLTLIPFVARRGRIDEALDLCDQAAEFAQADVLARVTLGVLRAGHPTSGQIERVEDRIAAAAEKAPPATRPSLDLALAELREIQGRFPEMTAIYRKLIEENGRNVVALNNLAWFLSFDAQDRGSSLEMINRAIRLAGPESELLDTRAVVRLNLDQPQEAVQDLEEALKETSTPTIYFHLAVAQSRGGDAAAAAESFRLAEQAGFDVNTLHPLEKEAYEKLVKSLPQPGRRVGG